MKKRFNIPFLLLGILASAILPFPSRSSIVEAQGRKTSSPEPAANLILGTVASERGTTATIPIYYQPGKNTRLRSLRMELDFVSNSVKFLKAEKGIAAAVQDYELSIDAKELPPDDKKITHTRINIGISLPDAETKKPLPEGLWVFLNFNIPPEAKPFSIALNPISISAQDLAKKPVEVAGEAGKIIVSVPDAPLAGCFFFSH